ncbi:hypothetical protein ACGFSI_42045 [Streptomyces virginiae]|uniref:hypothetical protein n=1 Tax=Streptomyces virginiae TaxID=1961 RepID=UPI00371ADE09
MDSAAVLVRCGICEALVPSGAVEMLIWFSEDGDEQTANRRSCRDAAACFLRADDPALWERLRGSLLVGVEPAPGAPVGRCTVCDVAARVGDLDIARVLDDVDDVWYSAVV